MKSEFKILSPEEAADKIVRWYVEYVNKARYSGRQVLSYQEWLLDILNKNKKKAVNDTE